MSKELLLSLKGIRKTYGTHVVLDDLQLQIYRGDYLAITGESGAGKSTLMNIIGTLDEHYQGEYCYRGRVIRPNERNEFRNAHMGFIFQQYNLLPGLTVEENVLLPYMYGKGRKEDIKARGENLLHRFKLYELKDKTAACLSGGEKQRVALARSLILEPEILLADEPTGNLDKGNARRVQEFLAEMHAEGKTIVLVTHDPEFAALAGRRVKITGGKAYEE